MFGTSLGKLCTKGFKYHLENHMKCIEYMYRGSLIYSSFLFQSPYFLRSGRDGGVEDLSMSKSEPVGQSSLI